MESAKAVVIMIERTASSDELALDDEVVEQLTLDCELRLAVARLRALMLLESSEPGAYAPANDNLVLDGRLRVGNCRGRAPP